MNGTEYIDMCHMTTDVVRAIEKEHGSWEEHFQSCIDAVADGLASDEQIDVCKMAEHLGSSGMRWNDAIRHFMRVSDHHRSVS